MIYNSEYWLNLQDHKADIVIIGAGAAGITLALELAKSNKSIILIEGGGRNFSDESQNIYRGFSDLRKLAFGLTGSRQRYLGGSTNCWAGGCGIFDPIDFKYRNWISYSGWPIHLIDLLPYYQKAAKQLSINTNEIWPQRNSSDLPNFNGLETKALTFTQKTRFNQEFLKEIEKNKNLHLYLNANLINFNRSSNGTLLNIEISSYNNRKKSVSANTYVLCCGGIENARLLLNSSPNNTYGAIGNSHNLVGKFFCEHPIAPCATFIPNKTFLKKFPYDTDIFYAKKEPISVPFYKLPDDIQKKYGTLNCAIQFQTQEPEVDPEILSAWNIYQKFKYDPEIMLSTDDLKNVINHPHKIISAFLGRKYSINSRIAMRFQIEQEPQPTNQIKLVNDKDMLGLHRVNLHYDFGDTERRTIDVLTSYTAHLLQRNKFGTLRLDSQLFDYPKRLPLDLRGGQHHCGTTRMSNSASLGVVNANLQVHDCSNLYILGSSVFPTNGWVNPTFTILALTYRLCDFLRKTNTF